MKTRDLQDFKYGAFKVMGFIYIFIYIYIYIYIYSYLLCFYAHFQTFINQKPLTKKH